MCAYWRILAARAFSPPHACDYVILLGDDVELLDSGWQGAAVHAFTEISADVFSEAPVQRSGKLNLPVLKGQRACAPGFGIVVIRDATFPGFPSFPIIPRMHAHILGHCSTCAVHSRSSTTNTSALQCSNPASDCKAASPQVLERHMHDCFGKHSQSTTVTGCDSHPDEHGHECMHHTELRIFPELFKNQDADPFLFALYRRFGAVRYLTAHSLTNSIGGATPPRYTKHSIPWSFDLLDEATDKVDAWLCMHGVKNRRRITLDIAVPSAHCSLDFLLPILALVDSEETMRVAAGWAEIGAVVVGDGVGIAKAQNPGGGDYSTGEFRGHRWSCSNCSPLC